MTNHTGLGTTDSPTPYSRTDAAFDGAKRSSHASRSKALTSALGQLAPSWVWRCVVALLAGTLTVAAMGGGLVWWFPWLQLGLVAGIVVGLIAPDLRTAGLVAAVATAVGLAIGPPFSFGAAPAIARLQSGSLTVVVSVAIALLARYLLSRDGRTARLLVWIAVALIVGNMWATTLTVNKISTYDPVAKEQLPPMNAQLTGVLPSDYEDSDHVMFTRIYLAVRAGQPYYESFREAGIMQSGIPFSSVFNIRFPLLSYLWSLLPGARWVVISFLLLASVAVVSVVPTVSGIVKLPLALPACAAMAAYFLYFPIQLRIYTMEPWGVALGLVALAALSVSTRSSAWRTLTVMSVVCAVLAVLLRETLVFVPMAGLVASVVIPGAQRRFRVASWATGMATVVVAYAVHYSLAAKVVDAGSSYQQFKGGDFSRVINALTFATSHLGDAGWFALTLALLGLIGVLAMPDPHLRVFTAIATLVPLTLFYFFSNIAWDDRAGAALNYWGAAVVPFLYALIPVAFGLLPGVASRTQQIETGAATPLLTSEVNECVS